MRLTLRRSCAACAKAKHACDRTTPKCSRCVQRSIRCIYANEPLTSTLDGSRRLPAGAQTTQQLINVSPRALQGVGIITSDLSGLSTTIGARSFDPFDSYPATSLPRLYVQSLIHHFLSKIAFQYYPLDLNPGSNPFITSWWPLALSDPALFNVSLQTASLDVEVQAQKGFLNSEILMKDSLSLIRHKIEDTALAFQDATMDAVVTLAAIEHGKGNLQVSKMHIDGVKRLVNVRGGLSRVKQTNPLTARMVPWVSMLVTGYPQFETQDDFGQGGGISTIPQWYRVSVQESTDLRLLNFSDLDLDSTIVNILTRLRPIFRQAATPGFQNDSAILSTTDLHDLTCFVLHRLLPLPPPVEAASRQAALSEAMRFATAIYMFTIHGPTYYSHVPILNSLVSQLKYHVDFLLPSVAFHDPLSVWLLSVGMVGSIGTNESQWFELQARALCAIVDIQCWKDVRDRLERVLWLERGCESLFRHVWKEIIVSNAPHSDFVV